MSIALLLLSMAAQAQTPAPPTPPSTEIIESQAIGCGLKVQNLKRLEGTDAPTHWMITPEPDGKLPEFKAFDCFLRWASTQNGLHIGFVGQQSTDSPAPADEPLE